MWSKIKRWFWRHGIIKCKHEWVPAREFYREYDGEDHDYLEPKPMKHNPAYKAAAYVCRKCYETYIAIEEIER
jgi:hypothetical protein